MSRAPGNLPAKPTIAMLLSVVMCTLALDRSPDGQPPVSIWRHPPGRARLRVRACLDFLIGQERGQGPDGRMLEQADDGDRAAQRRLQPPRHRDRGQRGAADLEELGL